MDRPWIAYVGPFHFPEGDAASRRVLGMAQSIAEAGYRVVIGSGESVPPTLTSLPLPPVGSLETIGLGEFPPRTASAAYKTARYLITMGSQTARWLSAQTGSPNAVIVYGASTPFLLHLIPWCARKRIPLIADLVEWYSHRHVPGGIVGPVYLSHELSLRCLCPRLRGIIAISSYLGDYYRDRGLPVVRIPPTLDTKGIEPRRSVEDAGILHLAYAGNPGKKDLLASVVHAIMRIDPYGRRIRLVIVGPTLETIRRLLQIRELPKGVEVIGRQTHQSTIETIRRADYTVLLRPPHRYARAGFPTKVVESLAVGTPVICNLTGDLGEYIHDGEEGLICSGFTENALEDSIHRALAIDPKRRQFMRRSARVRAEQSFDYRCHIEAMKSFLRGVTGSEMSNDTLY